MRRRYLSDEELHQVIKLKQAGASWLKIEDKTGVPRRSAKRAYEDWQCDQSMEELKAARTQVATEAFREHLESIIHLAEVVVDYLPESITFYEEKEASKVLAEIWMRDINKVPKSSLPFRQRQEKDQRRIVRKNQMLFQSLKDHTHEKVRWQVLEDWKRDWNACVGILEQLRDEARKTVMTILKEQKRDVWDRIEMISGEKNIIEDMIMGVTEAIWRGIISNKPKEAYNFVQTYKVAKKPTQVIFGEQASITVIELGEVNLADEVTNVCRWAIKNLCAGEVVEKVITSIGTLRSVCREIETMLNPLTLRPLIIRTRCELCPA